MNAETGDIETENIAQDDATTGQQGHVRMNPSVGTRWRVVVIVLAITVLGASASLQTTGETGVTWAGWRLPETCQWRRFTGVSCPGCGLTRSFVHTAHGRFIAAFDTHPLGPVFFAMVIGLIPYQLARLVRPPKPSHLVGPTTALRAITQWLSYGVLAVFLGVWVIRWSTDQLPPA